MQKKILIALSSLAIVGASCQSAAPSVSEPDPVAQAEQTQRLAENPQAGTYQEYDEALVPTLAQKGKVVIFFHASWCPTCTALDEDLIATEADFPDGLHVLKADFDTEINLRKEFGVTLQHTLVQVDADRKKIKMWNGGTRLETIVAEVQ